jgi:hypothetical protein
METSTQCQEWHETAVPPGIFFLSMHTAVKYVLHSPFAIELGRMHVIQTVVLQVEVIVHSFLRFEP